MSRSTKRGIAGGLIGVVFGVMLSWSGMASPDVIRGALLFQHAYLYLFMASAVGTAALGLWLLGRRERRAVLSDTTVVVTRQPAERRHVAGALVFGIGWGIAGACPGPIAVQIGQGIGWAAFTLAGLLGGVSLYMRRTQRETEPAVDRAPMPPGGGPIPDRPIVSGA
jgi:uncharacterized membrane protein YedE/YeeE